MSSNVTLKSHNSTSVNFGGLEESYEEKYSSDGRLMQVRVLDRDGDLVRDIDFFHQRGGGHAGITGTHTHEYRYNVNPKSEELKCARGRDTRDYTVRPFRPEDLPEKYHKFVVSE